MEGLSRRAAAPTLGAGGGFRAARGPGRGDWGVPMGDVRSREDAVLLRRVADGDRGAALEELYRRYERPVFEFGLRLLGDRELAAELVQETFLRLWRTAHPVDEGRGAGAALPFTIAPPPAVGLLRRPPPPSL